MHHMGILSNRSIFGPLFSLKLNSCTYYVQYNTNPIGLLHCAIRDHNDYVILLFSKHSQELTLSHLTRSVTGATNAVTVTHVGCYADMWNASSCQGIISLRRGASLIYWVVVSVSQRAAFCPPKGSAKIKQLPVIQNVQQRPACCCPLVAPSL